MPMTPIPFVPPLTPDYGAVEQVSPLIRRVIAENPSKYSYVGTGTYLVGHGDVAVIDPGPRLDAHLDALLGALTGERVAAILVTHCHGDHSPLATELARRTGAPTYAFGPAAPPSPDEEEDADDDELPEEGRDGVPEEPIDRSFVPDVALAHGAVISGPGWTFEALHTPGHTSNHMAFAFAEEKALFTGDHVMGWSTTVVTPPDGDMAAYLSSLRLLIGRDDATLWPTHGGPITDPQPFLAAYLAHREEREAQILDALATGLTTIPAIVASLYADVRPELHRAAGRSVLAHLVQLVAEGRVAVVDGDRPRRRSTYRLSER